MDITNGVLKKTSGLFVFNSMILSIEKNRHSRQSTMRRDSGGSRIWPKGVDFVNGGRCFGHISIKIMLKMNRERSERKKKRNKWA